MTGAGRAVHCLHKRPTPDEKSTDMALGTPRQIAILSACVAFALASTGVVAANSADPDSDGDGLSDFREVHMHCTDPHDSDSDDDGVPDGDWLERREFTYSVHAVVQVMPPISEDVLTGVDQDGRVLARGEDWIMLEVVLYPFSTMADAIIGNSDWRTRVAGLQQYIDPGPTTNWDEAMQRDMIESLRTEAGIDVTTANDKQIIERTSQWLMDRAKRCNSSSYDIFFEGGRPYFNEADHAKMRTIMIDPSGTFEEQFERELYGKGMYEHRMTGSCTSAANYLTTGLRAVGIPTRMVRAIPLVDVSNDEEIDMAVAGLTHHQLRREEQSALEKQRGSFSAHTYNEVFVGGRWHRLNYTHLGQGCHWPDAMGLMIVVHRYGDLAEAALAPTWGWWHGEHVERRPPFVHNNTYRTLSVTDSFGAHATIDNPPVSSTDQPPNDRRDHRRLTITRLYWSLSSEAPEAIRETPYANPATVMAHVDEWFQEERDGDQIKRFTENADSRFVLQSPGQPDVHAEVIEGCIASADGAMREILLMIDGDDLGTMASGTVYTLRPRNETEGYTWAVAEGVTLTAR